MIWTHSNKEIKSRDDMPDLAIGFVYIIEFTDGTYYIGSKQVISIRGAESNWKKYNGSSKDVLEKLKNGDLNIKNKEILEFAISKQDLLYKETRTIMCSGALEDNKSRNGWIKAKIFKAHIIEPKPMKITKKRSTSGTSKSKNKKI